MEIKQVRRTHTAEFKSKVALEALSERPTIVSPNQPITIITEDGRRATFWNVLGINIGEYPLSNGGMKKLW